MTSRLASWLRRIADRIDPASAPVDFAKIAAVTVLSHELTRGSDSDCAVMAQFVAEQDRA